MLIYVLASALFLLAFAPLVYALTAPVGYAGRHRGTRVQLIEQEAAYRLRMYALAMERRRAELIEFGVRDEWVMQ